MKSNVESLSPLKRMPRMLLGFLKQSAVWTAFCLVTEAICRFVLHWGFPYDYPAVPLWAIFGDFRWFSQKFAHFHSREFFGGTTLMYPAPIAVWYEFFFLKPHSLYHALFVTLRFEAFVILTGLAMLVAVRRALIARGLAPRSAELFLGGVFLLSFPFWFEVHQGNMEFAVWVTLAGGVWAFWTGRSWTAAVLFGIAGAMKLFPFVFIGLFIARKQYRECVVSVISAALATLASLWLVCPDIRYSWTQTNAAVAQFRTLYMLQLRPIESGFDHSFFALIKRLMPTLPAPARLDHILTGYMAVVALGGIVLYFTRIRKLPVVNQVLCLTIAAIFLPPVSYDYTLMHLYAPFVLLVFVVLDRARNGGKDVPVRGLVAAFALMAFLMSCQEEFIVHGLRIAGQMKAVALLALWGVALVYPFELDHRSPGIVDSPATQEAA